MAWHRVPCFAHEFCDLLIMLHIEAFIALKQTKHVDTKFLFLKRLVFLSHQVRTLFFHF